MVGFKTENGGTGYPGATVYWSTTGGGPPGGRLHLCEPVHLYQARAHWPAEVRPAWATVGSPLGSVMLVEQVAVVAS